MIQTETANAKILFVEVPNGAKDFRLGIIGSRLLFRPIDLNFMSDWVEIPEGNWAILNTTKGVTEEEARIVVPAHKNFFENETLYWFNYNNGAVMMENAKDALVYGIAYEKLKLDRESNYTILYELVAQ